MSWHDLGVTAGIVSTALFVIATLPMLMKAYRSRDLSSYSPSNLVIANAGNAVHTVYVLSLPTGPLWALHGFYLVSSGLMLFWWWRHAGGLTERGRGRAGRGAGPRRVGLIESQRGRGEDVRDARR